MKLLTRTHIAPLILSLSLIAFSCIAYGADNNDATFVLDFSSNDDTQTATIVPENNVPQYVTVDVNGETRTRFTATVVLKSASNLLGLNCDLVFDNTKLKVVDIFEAKGDLNFDGRANIADILTLAERYGQSTTSAGLAYFDRDSSDGANVIDDKDIDAVKPYISENNLFWTSNPNSDLSKIRESFEIFESPEVSNQNGKIDDIVTVLLPRIHPTPSGFGFDGDARVAEITFEVVSGATGETTLSFEDVMAIDESTEITQSQIINGSTPKFINVVVTLP